MIKKTKNKEMKTREQKIKERQEDVVLKLGIAPEVVELYDMYICGNNLMINEGNNSLTIDITENLQIQEKEYVWHFTTFRNGEVTALLSVSINPKVKGIRLRLW